MDFFPNLSASTQVLFRMGYGLAMLATILWTFRPGIWFFRSERWGGYGDRSPRAEFLQNPFAHALLTGLWIAANSCLVWGHNTVAFAALNLAICWYYFVFMRWHSLLRGMGAPGFFCYWMGAAVLILETGRHLDHTGIILIVGLLTLQWDYALIQLCAGSYKGVCGYSRNTGMQLGLANPMWGHHWRFYKKMDPAHPLFRFLNQVSFRVQIMAGLLMLIPSTRWLGAAAIALSFLFVMTQIRLGFLLPKVMLGALLFVPAGSTFDRWLSQFVEVTPVSQSLPGLPLGAIALMVGFLTTYLVLLPLAKMGQWYNFLKGKSLPGPWQSYLERWCNAFGIIIWRVFSVDVIDFFVRIYITDEEGEETEYTCFGKVGGQTRGRYLQVAESIALVSIFTTLKYHPSDSDFFREKLLRYARTLPHGGRGVRFAYTGLEHRGRQFEFVPMADFMVDLDAGTIVRRGQTRQVCDESPVRASVQPGSYLPVVAQNSTVVKTGGAIGSPASRNWAG